MHIPSLKDLAITGTVNKLLIDFRDGKIDQTYKLQLPDEISKAFANYLLRDRNKRQKALAHIICKDTHEFNCSRLFDANKMLGIIFECFPNLTTLDCANSTLDSLELAKQFAFLNSNKQDQLLKITTLNLSGLNIET